MILCRLYKLLKNIFLRFQSQSLEKNPEISTEPAELPEEWTDNGELCKTKCKKDGEAYNWCWKVGKSWDYCSPGNFLFTYVPTMNLSCHDYIIPLDVSNFEYLFWFFQLRLCKENNNNYSTQRPNPWSTKKALAI